MTTNACLIIIDMQKGMASEQAGRRNNPAAEQNTVDLLHTWRASGKPIVHVRHISRSSSSPFAPGQPGVEFQDSLQPLPQEHVVEKNVTDVFAHSGLERWLRVRGIEELVFVGVATNYSVEASARTAGNLGFRTLVVSDACFAFAMTDYAGTERSADEVHAMALANLDGEYARILDTRSVLKLYC